MLLAFSLGVSEGLVMVLARSLLGYAYANDKQVALYTSRLMPILAASTLFDCLQCVLSGTGHLGVFGSRIFTFVSLFLS
jgi:multidrug resistance protein, MATE family